MTNTTAIPVVQKSDQRDCTRRRARYSGPT